MNIWPWSRIAQLETQLNAVCAKLEHAELSAEEHLVAATEADDKLRALTAQHALAVERSRNIQQKFEQAQRDYEATRQQLTRLQNDIASKARPSIVLSPPTKRVDRSPNNPPVVDAFDNFVLENSWPFADEDFLGI